MLFVYERVQLYAQVCDSKFQNINQQIMSGCLDQAHCPEINCPDLSERRNQIASVLAGSLFFTGWWIIIDVAANDPLKNNVFHICGVASTVAVFMINAISNAQVRGETFDGGCIGQTGARIWLLIGFLFAFGGLIGACWVLFGSYVATDDPNTWPGVAVFLQNSLIFFSALVFKFGRTEEDF
ncbi:transmembrane protein 50B-like isoform X2 [Hydractinia symbiolongicarpus]|uniref:transmembrane protein 50B-like isoform X2 n=1 Tax=Hydractinia symbiolongicarpus TaxID=13093 RepID=UPI002551127D|nr:transmembrane protein 50B-like isoform X2 [Hydractinia symbiolongicarpus]